MANIKKILFLDSRININVYEVFGMEMWMKEKIGNLISMHFLCILENGLTDYY